YLPYSQPDQWQFFAAVWKGASNEVRFCQATSTQAVKLGTVAMNDVATGGLVKGQNTRWNETVGNSQQKYHRPFNGSIDNVRYYSTALDENVLESIRQADLKNMDPSAASATTSGSATAS